MDKLKQYQEIIQRILGEHLEFLSQEKQVEIFTIAAEANGHYLLLEVGWQPPRRIYR